MNLILRAIIIYVAILLIFRMSGKRTLSQLTTFDFILLLMVGEATQQALVMDDQSITGALLIIGTLVSLDVLFAWFSKKSVLFDKVANGVPVIILKNGQLIKENMGSENIDMDDILEAARRDQGLESLDQVKYAVLEKDGRISIIPKSEK